MTFPRSQTYRFQPKKQTLSQTLAKNFQKTFKFSKLQKIQKVKMALIATNATSEATLKAATELMLVQFLCVYDEVKEAKNFTGPNADDLLEWMRETIYGGLQNVEASSTTKPTNKNTKKVAEVRKEEKEPAPVVAAAAADDESTQVAEADEAAPVAATDTKLESSKLKELTIKVTKTKKTGEEHEVDEQVELPYLPHCIDYTKSCQAIAFNGGLMTPCPKRRCKNSEFCKGCSKGTPYGTIADREAAPLGSYSVEISGKKKSEISYGTYLAKRGTERTFVEDLLTQHFGDAITIPESYYTIDQAKAKRGVKSTSSNSSENGSEDGDAAPAPAPVDAPIAAAEPAKEEAPKKRRGRPSKKQQVVVEEVVVNEVNVVVNNAPEPEAPAPASEPEQPAAQPVAPEPQPEPQPQPEQPQPAAAAPVEEESLSDIELDDDDDDDEWTYIVHNGKKLAYDEDCVLFDIDDEDDPKMVGTWDPESNKPVFDEA